jgi:general L-amino acid transport system permease protein
VTRFLRDRDVRRWIAQIATIAVLAAIVGYFISNALTNVAKAGIATGFGFLDVTTGLDEPFKLIAYGPQSTYGRLLLVGILNTLLVTVTGIVLATLLGFLIGIARLSRNWLLSRLAGGYVEFVRNVPLLLFVFYWYFGVLASLPAPRGSWRLFDVVFVNNRGVALPAPEDGAFFVAVGFALTAGVLGAWMVAAWARRRQAASGKPFPTPLAWLVGAGLLPLGAAIIASAGVDWDMPRAGAFNVAGGVKITPEFVALLGALVTYTAGFIAENVRAGILAVAKGQREAAAALGLRPGLALRLVVVPQALRVVIPPLTNQYLNLLKNSTFGQVIAFPEIFKVLAGTTFNQVGQAIEIMFMLLSFYLAVGLAVSAAMNWYNRRIALVTR